MVALLRVSFVAVLLAAAVSASAAASSAPRPGEVVEKHDDGSPKVRYRTDAKGRRSGAYEEFYPGGKIKVRGSYAADQKNGKWMTYGEDGKVLENATYKKDLLDGPYVRNFAGSGRPQLKAKYKAGQYAGPVTVLDEKGRTLRRVNYPRPRSAVEAAWAKLHPASASTPPKFTTEPSLAPPYKAGRIAPESLDEALRLVKLYRFLSGLPWENLKTDAQLCDKAQHGAVVVHKLGRLTHTPERPDDMDAAFFKIGYEGCNQSNLHMGNASLAAAVHGWMDDSDPSNVEKIGHRQWIFTPGLQRVGFGYAGRFSAMHVLDGARPGPPELLYAAFPGEGYYPRELVRPHYAWSLHLNGTKVMVGGKGAVEVKVLRLDDVFAETEEIPTSVVNVSGAAGNQVTVIFKPDLKAVAAGRYWVEVDGIRDAKGKSAPLGYLVELIDMPAAAAPAAP